MNLKYPEILKDSFITMIVGKSGSGKSYLLSQLLLDEDLYGHCFDEIIYFSPSIIHKELG